MLRHDKTLPRQAKEALLRILVIEHHDTPSLGVLGEALIAEKVETHVVWGEDGGPIPDRPDEFDGMVVLGGAMNALDDERCPYFPKLVTLIRGFTDQERPVMGICLGAQLIARTFGGQPHLDGPFEFGFHPVTLTDEGRADPVFGHMPDTLNLFQWHTDHYDLPPDTVKIVSGADYENQAYRIGRATYGTQFHFEVSVPIVEGWLSHHLTGMENRVPGYREWLPRQFEAHMENSKAFCREVTRRWLGLCR